MYNDTCAWTPNIERYLLCSVLFVLVFMLPLLLLSLLLFFSLSVAFNDLVFWNMKYHWYYCPTSWSLVLLWYRYGFDRYGLDCYGSALDRYGFGPLWLWTASSISSCDYIHGGRFFTTTPWCEASHMCGHSAPIQRLSGRRCRLAAMKVL